MRLIGQLCRTSNQDTGIRIHKKSRAVSISMRFQNVDVFRPTLTLFAEEALKPTLYISLLSIPMGIRNTMRSGVDRFFKD